MFRAVRAGAFATVSPVVAASHVVGFGVTIPIAWPAEVAGTIRIRVWLFVRAGLVQTIKGVRTASVQRPVHACTNATVSTIESTGQVVGFRVTEPITGPLERA